MPQGSFFNNFRRSAANVVFFAGIFFMAVFAAWGSGITVPSGSRLNINSGKINLELENNSGNVTNAGIIAITTGQIKMNGSWSTTDAAAYLISGAGTIDFSAASGTQYIAMGPNSNDYFFDLTHSGDGEVELVGRSINIEGSFNNQAGTFKTNNHNMTVAGNWSNVSLAAFISGSATVTFDGGDQTIAGDTSFNNFTKMLADASSHTLTFPAGHDQHVVRWLTLRGYDDNHRLNLLSSTDNSEAFLTLQKRGVQDINAVDVKDNNASHGITLVARGLTSTNLGNNTNWKFGAVSIKWDGTVDKDWNNPFNWNLGLVPGPQDTAIVRIVDEDAGFAPILNQPVLTGISPNTGLPVINRVANLVISAGATLTLDQQNMTIDGGFTVDGTIVLDGTETVSSGSINDNGTFTYYGTQNTNATITLTRNFMVGGNYLTTFNNLIINEQPLGLTDSFTTDAPLTISHAMTLDTGLFTIGHGFTLSVQGSLSANGGTFLLAGDVSVTGVMNMTGTPVTLLDATVILTDLQTLNLSAGTLDALAGNMRVHTVDISGGTLLAPGPGRDFAVSGDFTHSGGIFTHDNGTVTLDGSSEIAATDQLISGDSSFFDLVKQVPASAFPGQTLTFVASSTQTIGDYLMLKGGLDASHLLLIRSTTGVAGNLNLVPNAGQAISNVDVSDNAATGLTLVARDLSVQTGNNTPNWVFQVATITWDGSESTDWNTKRNWDLGLVPVANDNVIVTNGALIPFQPVLSGDVTIGELSMQVPSTTLNLTGFNMTVHNTITSGGTLSNEGTIYLRGTEQVYIDTPDPDSGMFIYQGDDVSSVKLITSLGPRIFYNLWINDQNAQPSNFTLSNDMTINGSLTIDGGTMTSGADSIDLAGSFSLLSGAFVAPGPAKTLFVGGDFIHSGGTFTHNSGTVVLDAPSAIPSMTQVISGDTTFYELIKQVPAGAQPLQQLTFAHGSTQSVVQGLVLQGETSLDPLFLRSDVNGSQAYLKLEVGGLQTIGAVNVQDSNASGVTLVARTSPDHTNGFNNTNWIFGVPLVQWDGSGSTDWGNPLNWDLGLVPITGDNVVIRSTDPLSVPPDQLIVNQPVMSAGVAVGAMTLDSGTSLTVNGFALTIADTLTNNGNIIAQGGELIKINVTDTAHGTFTYTGNNSGLDLLSSFDASGVNAYHDLVFLDAGAADVFRSQADIHVFGNLTMTSGGVDISTGSDSLQVDGSMRLASGTSLEAFNGDINLTGSIEIRGGLSAPTAGHVFLVGGSWTLDPLGTFGANSGKVLFNTSSPASVTGNTTFYSLEFNTDTGKTVTFEAGSTQTILNALDLVGSQTGRLVMHSAVDGTKWTFNLNSIDDMSKDNALARFVDVKDSIATGPAAGRIDYIMALNSDNQPVDITPSSNTGWLFIKLMFIAPVDSRVTGVTPVLIGQAVPGRPYTVQNDSGVAVASGVADTRGYFRTELTTNLLAGQDTLTPYYGLASGLSSSLTIDPSPTTAQVPVISGPSTLEPLTGDVPYFWGVAKPGETVYVVSNNTTNDLSLPLTTAAAASTIADVISGDYSMQVQASKSFKRGKTQVSVVSNGVSSAINAYTLYDMYGRVFDSSTNEPLNKAEVLLRKLDNNGLPVAVVRGTDIPLLDTEQANPFVTDINGVYHFRITGEDTLVQYVLYVKDFGYTFPTTITDNSKLFPGDRVVVNGSRGEGVSLQAVVKQIDLPADANQYLFKVTKVANKPEARIGEVVTYTVTIENLSDQNSVQATRLYDIIPPGFKFMEGRVHFSDGTPIETSGTRPVVFKIGTFMARQVKTMMYQLVIGAGVAPGDYENTAFLRYDSGILISNRAHAIVKVVMDPLFDAGTVFGKVFWDLNENGRQDEPEYDYENRQEVLEGPVPNVHLVMEDGTSITADKTGLFHVPGLLVGRHVIMVDQRSLPKGAFMTTDKAQVIDVTPGMVVKVNFGVNMGNDQVVGEDAKFFDKNLKVDQTGDHLTPLLNADMFEKELLLHTDTVIQPVEFKLFMNYAPFISSWKLDIVDKETKRLVREFNGSRYNVNNSIIWDGRDIAGKFVRVDRKYAYMLKVQDEQGVWDETKEKDIHTRVLTDLEFEALGKKTADEIKKEADVRDKTYRAWQLAQAVTDNTDHRNIFVRGETLTVDPEETEIRSVRVLKDGVLFVELPLPERQVLTARGLLDGETVRTQPVQVILPDGDYELEVVSAQESGAAAAGSVRGTSAPDTSALAAASGVPALDEKTSSKNVKVTQYRRPVKVGDDYMTFVAMGDGKVGYNLNRGNIEPVRQVDTYQRGFYQDGKMAYYLKGKIKGKYLLTSSFDSERQQKAMFRSVKDDQYYPVYGDSSTINYDATNTQGNLYVMMEWDKSQAVWGNYAIDFNDTEFARYSRTLYGGKVDYTSVASNPYGDAKTKVAMFHAEVRQRSAHNEFLGTGGSLYYFKHQGVVVGTAKIHLEVRDAVTGQVRSTTDMKDGVDYDIDNSQGRVLFWQPVAMSADSGNIISNQLLKGNPVYVVADYEYEVNDKIMEATQGVRVAQAVGKNVVVGGTYVTETQAAGDYKLKGEDVTVHVGQDTKIKAEYATTESQDSSSYVSTDGGITFNELVVGNLASGKAYGITQDTRLFDRLGLKSYYKWIENNFASASTSSQQGKAMSGLGMTFDLTPVTRLTANYDVQKLIQQGNLQTSMQVGAQETSTTVLQLAHDARRLRIVSEFRHQEVIDKNSQYVSESNQVQNTLALQAEYDVDDKTKLTSKYQVDPTGKASKEGLLTTGITRKLNDKLSATVAESFGTAGNATKVGATLNVTPKISTTVEESFGTAGKASRVGAVANITPNMALTTDFQTAQAPGGAATQTRTTSLIGKEKLGDKTSIQTNYSMVQTDKGPTKTVVGVNAGSEVKLDDVVLKAGVQAQADDKVVSVLNKGAGIDAAKTDKEGHTTTSAVKVDETPTGGKVTTVTLGDRGLLAPGRELAVERTFAFGQAGQDRGDVYKVVQDRDGKKVETSYTRKLSDTQAQRSASNIFGLTGDVNDRVAANGSMEQGIVQNIDGSLYHRTAIAAGFGYVEKDEEGKEKIKSSTKAELRLDRGDHSKQQVVLYQDAQGKLNDEMTLSAKFQYSQTKDKELNKVEAQYKEIMLGTAYRPIMDDKLNLFAKYTYKENQGPSGQLNISDVEQTTMQVLAVEGAYDLTADWQLVEKLAYRIMEEKVAGFDFTKTHTWLLVNRANYRLNQDWKIGAEYRILTQKEAKDQKTGYLVEAVHSLNDNVELGVGYNFTDFVDDLTNLSYTVQGPYIRMTGKLYDRTPEERARARQKWLDRRIEIYAWKMVNTEFTRKDSPVVLEMNAMYRMAQVASKAGRYEESRKIYKDVVLATQLMFEEAANFVRRHISFEEKLYNAAQRAKEYYDKGELWAAKKLWEKIVEEAERSMLQ